MKLKLLILATFLFGCSDEQIFDCTVDFKKSGYTIIAHSHNDYEQAIPIDNALNHGFQSIEVDIAFDGLNLRVSHDDKNLDGKPLFEDAYLSPILNHNELLDSSILLVDIKNYSPELINKLNETLLRYESKIKSRENLNSNKTQIILSGEIPRQELINNSENKYIFVDGRYNQNNLNYSSDIVPLISLNISDISDSNAKDDDEIRKVIDHVHDSGKMIRFWNTSDKEEVWLKLIQLNIDIIGVDNIEKFCFVMENNNLIN